MHHYPHHIGDYRAATAHLSNEEDLAYRRLLDMYYDRESRIPADIPWVSRRLRVGSEVVMRVLQDFFEETPEGWLNRRCEDEIVAYRNRIEQARANGSLGGRPRKNRPVNSANRTKPNPKLTSTQEPVPSTQEPVPEVQSRASATAPASGMAKRPDDVEPDLWRAFLSNRTAKRKPLTARAWAAIANRIAAAGISATDALSVAVEHGWADWRPDWSGNGSAGGAVVKKHISREVAMPGFSKDQPKEDWEL